MGNSMKVLVFLVPCLAIGCERHEQVREPVMRPASRTVQGGDGAVLQIASARCDHEERCNNIGPDEKYSTRQHCVNEMSPEARDSVGKCEYGVDQHDLRECVAALSREECNAPLQNMKSFKECETDNLCLTESERNGD